MRQDIIEKKRTARITHFHPPATTTAHRKTYNFPPKPRSVYCLLENKTHANTPPKTHVMLVRKRFFECVFCTYFFVRIMRALSHRWCFSRAIASISRIFVRMLRINMYIQSFVLKFSLRERFCWLPFWMVSHFLFQPFVCRRLCVWVIFVFIRLRSECVEYILSVDAYICRL